MRGSTIRAPSLASACLGNREARYSFRVAAHYLQHLEKADDPNLKSSLHDTAGKLPHALLYDRVRCHATTARSVPVRSHMFKTLLTHIRALDTNKRPFSHTHGMIG